MKTKGCFDICKIFYFSYLNGVCDLHARDDEGMGVLEVGNNFSKVYNFFHIVAKLKKEVENTGTQRKGRPIAKSGHKCSKKPKATPAFPCKAFFDDANTWWCHAGIHPLWSLQSPWWYPPPWWST